jgi:hypothetical protein
LTPETAKGIPTAGKTSPAGLDSRLFTELWTSLASLLRSYTAAHGLNGDRQATVELGEAAITVRYGEKWLALERSGATITWMRENRSGGVVELTRHGRLAGATGGEQEMDMAAEAWARELMRETEP